MTMASQVASLPPVVRRAAPTGRLRAALAAVLALEGVLTLVAGTTSSTGIGLSWALDLATGLTALALAGSLLEGDLEPGWTSAWCLAIGVAGVAAQLADGHAFDALLRVPGALALVLISAGPARGLRSALAVLLLCVPSLALGSDASALRTGLIPLQELRLRFDDRLTGAPLSSLEGERVPYRIDLPPGRWFDSVPPASARALTFDRWVVEPERDADLQVRFDALPGAAHFDLDALVTRAERHHPAAELVSMEPLTNAFDGARLLHLAESRGLRPREFWSAVFVRGDVAFEVTASAPKTAFATLGDDLRASVTGFSYLPATAPALPLDALTAVKRATALVRTEWSAGSGALIGQDERGAYVLTNAHVVLGEDGEVAARARLHFPGADDDAVYPASVLRFDRDTDLALLRCDPLALLPLALRDSAAVPSGTPAFAAGFPMGPSLVRSGELLQPTVNAGRLLGTQPDGSRLVSVGLNPGNSGGPVVASDGSIIGLAQAMVPDSETSAMVPSARMRAFLGSDLPVLWTTSLLPSPHLEGLPTPHRAAAESALVQVWAAGDLGPGVVVGSTADALLILARLDLVVGTEADALTVGLTMPSACGAPMAAKVLRLDPAKGLVLLAIDRPTDAPAPLALSGLADVPETTPLTSLGWRVRTSPFVPREPVVRLWREGQLSSKQLDKQGRLSVALADVGINPDYRGGPLLDDDGRLAGFTTRDGDPTNLTRIAPAESIRRFLDRAAP